MQQLVECVPNFSNGRNPEVYNAIADAIQSVSGIHLLDISADHDHNRTVITFVGAPDDVVEAAFRGIKQAAQLIDLDVHSGEHPRIGATDVCPFIPIKNISIKECVKLAKKLGKRVGGELGVAVYLYGSAAIQKNRKTLAAIRKGEYEKWKAEVATKEARKPDFGPAEPKSWGATVIGVRPFLIAYNLYLNTDDVQVAEDISRGIRYSSGGFRYVQAKGFLVDGQAQVSMNLTNFEKTPIYRVQELVKREAAQHGYAVTKAELVGLIPQKALMETAKWYLQLGQMADDQVLEYRIQEKPTEPELAPRRFVEAVAAKTATPGGGAVAALAGALGASLSQMVARLTIGRKKYESVRDETEALLSRAISLQDELLLAITEDIEAFDELMSTWRNKELEEAFKAVAIEEATIHAGEVPLRVARLSLEVVQLAKDMTRMGNKNAVTDAASAAIMARAAVQAATLNVKINATGLNDQELAAEWTAELETINTQANDLVDEVIAIAAERGGF